MPAITGGFKHVGVVGHAEPSVEYEIFASFEVGMEMQPTVSRHNAATNRLRIKRTSHGIIEKVLSARPRLAPHGLHALVVD